MRRHDPRRTAVNAYSRRIANLTRRSKAILKDTVVREEPEEEPAADDAVPLADAISSMAPSEAMFVDYLLDNMDEIRATFRPEPHSEPLPKKAPASEGLCPACGGRKLVVAAEAAQVCDNCGLAETVLGTALDPHVANGPREMTDCAYPLPHSSMYKRINHFNETLTQIQGQERTAIPQELLDTLKAQFKKYRVEDTSKVTAQMVRQELKKMRLVKYYEHAHQIANTIAKRQAVAIPLDVQEKLRVMFQQIQEPFNSIRPQGRSNFLSYSYTIHKFLQLLGRQDLTAHFPLLKSRTKLFQQDSMWRDICQIMNWPFVPSV